MKSLPSENWRKYKSSTKEMANYEAFSWLKVVYYTGREIVRSMSQTSICDMFFSWRNVAMTRGTFFLGEYANDFATLKCTYHHISKSSRNISFLIIGQSCTTHWGNSPKMYRLK